MNRLRGLAGLFTLLLFLSGIGLSLVILDDNKDLSSRASINPLQPVAKPLESFPEIVSFTSYDPKTWLMVEENFFLNQTNGDTLRVINKDIDISSVSSSLGSEFTSRKVLGNINHQADGWVQEKYSYKFFGETKKVNLWKSKNLSALEIGKIDADVSETISFLKTLNDNKQVLGTNSTPDDSAKLATLIRPSVAMILNHYCTELKFFNAPGFALSDKVYPFCLTSMGTGFFISSDGLLATNGHIVKNLPRSALYYGISSGKLDNLLNDFLNIYFSQINNKIYTTEEISQKVKEAHANKVVLYQIGGLIADLNKKNILKFQNDKNDYYLQVGSQVAEVTNDGIKENDGIVKATLIDSDYQEHNDQTGFVSSDVALLKAASGIYPGLALGSIEDAYVGSNLQVVGFPAAAISSGNLLDTTSASEPTFTKGVVSAIKLAKGNQKKLIQTDAIINHGNSGGPAVLQNGKVVGIATYGVAAEEGSGSYNFLRDIQDLKDIVTKQNLNLSQGEIFTLWQQGLDNYWLGYFKYSSEKFRSIAKIYPQHPMVNRYLSSSDQKIDTVEDLTPKLTHAQRSSLIYFLGSVMAISAVSLCIVLYLLYSKKHEIEQIPNVPTF